VIFFIRFFTAGLITFKSKGAVAAITAIPAVEIACPALGK
jgi:hypothetical protein